MEKKNFVILGAGGFVAPRHMAAIKAVGGRIIAAMDPSDNVGVLDSYQRDCEFFTEFEQLYNFVDMFNVQDRVHYVVICSPNYLHESHITWALNSKANVICEKPMALNTLSATKILWHHNTSADNVNVILQCRLHPVLIDLKSKLDEGFHQVQIKYNAPRGRWYKQSWKGDKEKSGGVATNIGIHLFDLLCWYFGEPDSVITTKKTDSSVDCLVEFCTARASISLSISGDTPIRMIKIDDKPVEFSNGFANLHEKSYIEIMKGNGFTPETILPATKIIDQINKS